MRYFNKNFSFKNYPYYLYQIRVFMVQNSRLYTDSLTE